MESLVKLKNFNCENVKNQTDNNKIVTKLYVNQYQNLSETVWDDDDDDVKSFTDTASVHSSDYEYLNNTNDDTQSANSDDYDDYKDDDTISIHSDSDSDFAENFDTDLISEEAIFDTSRRTVNKWNQLLLPRSNFVPPVYRDGHWIMPVQRCDANLGQTTN